VNQVVKEKLLREWSKILKLAIVGFKNLSNLKKKNKIRLFTRVTSIWKRWCY